MTHPIEIPAWIDQDINKETIEAIVQGGCASGAYMPAVTYCEALETMNKHGDDVMDYLSSNLGQLPEVNDITPWAGIAVLYVSEAVELWAYGVDLDDFSKEVDYFGVDVTVPHGTTHLAMDSDGELWAYNEEPEASFNAWNTTVSTGGALDKVEHDQEGNDCPFWSQSMVEV